MVSEEAMIPAIAVSTIMPMDCCEESPKRSMEPKPSTRPMKRNGMTRVAPTIPARSRLNRTMPKIRHQELRASRRERDSAVTTPCFSSISAGAARL